MKRDSYGALHARSPQVTRADALCEVSGKRMSYGSKMAASRLRPISIVAHIL